MIRIVKYFPNQLVKYSSQSYRFQQLFNQNRVKLTYNCISDIKKLVNIHNENVLKTKPSTKISNRNGGNKGVFSFIESCKISGVIGELCEVTISISQSDYKEKNIL